MRKVIIQRGKELRGWGGILIGQLVSNCSHCMACGDFAFYVVSHQDQNANAGLLTCATKLDFVLRVPLEFLPGHCHKADKQGGDFTAACL